MNKYIEEVLREMCKRVGADFDKIDFKKEDWFMEYIWTDDQEDSFKIWMVDYLYNNTKARNEILEYTSKNKKRIRKAAAEFLVNYGWRLK